MPPNPAYHVVALSMPIVYTREGDHDPNGLLFTLKAHEPLLRWARDRWEDHDGFLPRLHQRRQRIQLVVDNLGLLNLIVPRLRAGSDADRELLAELVRREHVGGVPGPASDPDEDDDEDGSGRDRLPPHDRAVRQNVLRVVGDLRFALDELAGAAEAEAGVPEPDERLVSLSDAERAALLAHWTVQRDQADAAVEAWIVALNADPARRLDPVALEQQSGVPAARIARLLLNDHSTAWTGTGAHRYDRFNPLRPIPLVRPLVLRARVGEPIRVRVENQIRGRRVGFHVQGARAGRAAGHAVRGAVRRRGAHRPQQRQHHRVRGEPDPPVRRAVRGRLADQRPGRRPRHPGGQQRARPVRRAGRRADTGTTWRDPETGDDLTFRPLG